MSCDRAARGSSTTRAERRRRPRTSKSGFSPQLTLEAAMLQQGRLRGAARRSKPRQAIYLKLGGAAGGEEKHAGGKDENIANARRAAFRRAQDAARRVRLRRRRPTCRARSPNSRPVFRTTTIWRGSRNGRRPAARAIRGHAVSRALAIPETLEAATGPGVKPEDIGLGLRQRRQRQDPCSHAARPAAAARWDAAGANPVPRLHQGGGRQHGRSRFRQARAMDEPQRRRLGEGDRRLRRGGAGPRDLIFARQLFARTIESPGGLKI